MPELAVGKMFNPWWGLRLQGGGGALHGFTDNAGSMLHMHYMHMNIDFMMGLINFFAKYNPDRKFDIVPFFGVGGMTRKHQQSFTIHGGIQAKYKISERFDANIEFQGMIFNDKMVETGGFPNDGLGGLTAGVTYYFKGRGFRTAPKQAVIDEMAAANLVLANQVTQLQNRPPEIKVIEKEVVRPVETKNVEIVESIPSTIPFKFNSAVVQDIYDPLIYNIGTFMKNNPDVKIRIVGYADKFGPINVNLRISQERAEAVANMLKKDYGINSNRMVIEYVGKKNLTTKTTTNGIVVPWLKSSNNPSVSLGIKSGLYIRTFLLNIFFTFPQHFRFHFILVPFKLPAGMSVLAEVRPIKEIILYFCPAKSNYMLSFSAYGPKTISEKT